MTQFSSDDRQAICETFDKLLAHDANEEVLRSVIETETGFDSTLWRKMAELGLLGVMVSPDYEGLGGSIQEAEALMEIAGHYLYSGPYISSSIVTPVLLQACTDVSVVAPYLKKIVSGDAIFAVAGCGVSGDWTESPDVKAIKKEDYWELSGSSYFVTHAVNATHSLVIANEGGVRQVFLVDMNSARVAVKHQKTDDKTLRISHIVYDKALAIRLEGVGENEIHFALQIALIALAGEQVGATRRIFNLTIEYLNTRFQFGQPIGRFQALKHMAADLLIEVESASSVARHGAQSVATKSNDSALFAYLAGFTCADNFRKVAADAIQLHGGIAYTMEHPAHLFWRRAQTGQWLYGSSDKFRELYLLEMEAKL